MPLPESDPDLPLAGVRVLDFSTTVAGTSAVRHLADFGAQVIKIESQAHPDTLRAGTPYAGGVAGINRSGYFGAFFRARTRAELFEWAIARGVMLAPVQTLADLAGDRQLESREAWRSVDLDGEVGTVRVPGPPARLSDVLWEPAGPPPRLGEHNRAVYGDELGLTPGELTALKAAGAI